MENHWFILVITFCIAALLKAIFSVLYPSRKSYYPPGPFALPFIGNPIFLFKFFTELEPTLNKLHAKYGPIFTVYMGSSTPTIFVSDHSLAHQALVHNGAFFAQRPKALAVPELINNKQHNINSAFYGPTWRVLRRNLYSEILHATRMRSFSHGRKWAMQVLMNSLKPHVESGAPVPVNERYHLSLFGLLSFMIFGVKLDEETIHKIEYIEYRVTLSFREFSMLNVMPRLTKILFKNKWQQFLQILQLQRDTYLPLIRARANLKKQRKLNSKDNEPLCYVDTLLDLELPHDNNRKLTEIEIVGLCSEFYNAGGDTTTTAMHWIIANVVKYPEVQEKLYQEMKKVVGDETEEIREEDLPKLPYCKAVVLEGLRRHPPGHFLMPHVATEDVELGGYLIPKNGALNFMVKDMSLDPKVWEDPLEFKPERFLKDLNGYNGGLLFDVTGSKEIKMLPFGAGRRVCPGYHVGIHHLEYYLANMVWAFKWAETEEGVDLSEKLEFLVGPKNPVMAYISPRVH